MEKETTSFDNLFYNNPGPCWIYDLSTYKILNVNEAALKYYCCTKEEFLNYTALQLITKNEVPLYVEAHKSISKNENYSYLGTFQLHKNDAKGKTVEIYYYKATIDDNQCFFVVCKELLSKTNEEHYASQMLDESLDVFCTINEEGNFVYVSAASKKHWGYFPKELIGMSFVKLIYEEDIPKTISKAQNVLNGQNIKSFVNRYLKKQGGIAYNIWSVI
jgi:PAS domain S-box-containing protein